MSHFNLFFIILISPGTCGAFCLFDMLVQLVLDPVSPAFILIKNALNFNLFQVYSSISSISDIQ